ncbi:MAG: polysaccharide deacetylase family protein [Puniceicoccaceae bacterium]
MLLVGALGIGQILEGKRLENAFPFPLYEQEIRLEFRSVKAAKQAEIRVAPVFGDHERAVSSRYDDNSWHNMPVKELLDKYGSKATWYLNSNSIFYQNGADYRPEARKLLENGYSIGGHGFNHPYISYTNRNRMFQEVAQVRMEWEAELDTQVNSYAFSFVNYINRLEGVITQADAFRSLERAGYYHLATFKNVDESLPSEMIYSLIMPPENQSFQDFKAAVDWAMSDESLKERFRCISHSMHAWYGTPALNYELDELERRIQYMNSFPDLWHCNQNQYAAYRYQYLHTEIAKIKREGRQLVVRLKRPELRFLNDPTPLTFVLSGSKVEDLLDIQTEGETVGFEGKSGGEELLFNLPHGPSQALPVRIGKVENPDNRKVVSEGDEDPDFPGLRTLLHFDGNSLNLQILNDGVAELNDIQVSYRSPLAWEEGVKLVEMPSMAAGEDGNHEWVPSVRKGDPKYMGGSHFFVAQIDFRIAGQPGRLFASCSYEVPFEDSFPRDGFRVLGPIHPDQFQLESVESALQASSTGFPVSVSQKDGATVNWLPANRKLDVPASHFDPEVVPTTASWYQSWSPYHLLATTVLSETRQKARLVCDPGSVRAVYLNGIRVKNFQLQLNKGENALLIVHDHSQFTGNGEHSGAFIRFTKPGSQDRLESLRFLQPELSPLQQ